MSTSSEKSFFFPPLKRTAGLDSGEEGGGKGGRHSFWLDQLPQWQSGNNWEDEMQKLILSGIPE